MTAGLLDATLVDLYARFLAAWSEIVRDVSSATSPAQVLDALASGDRLFYVGILATTTGIMLFTFSSSA